MSEEKRRVTRLRQKVQFGNGEMKDIGRVRQDLATYTSAITLFEFVGFGEPWGGGGAYGEEWRGTQGIEAVLELDLIRGTHDYWYS